MNALRISSLVLVMIILVAFSWQPAQAAWSTNPSENTPVCDVPGLNQDAPQMVTDGNGGFIAVWRDVRLYSGESDIYLQRMDASGIPMWAPNSVAVCTESGHQVAPALVSDGAGGAVITWMDYRSSTPEIYAQRVDSSGSMLWTTNGVSICSSVTGNPWEPQITSDGAGGAIITWIDSRNGNWDIYAQRVDSSGAVQWAVDGVAVCTAAYEQKEPAIVSDGNNGAIITWTDLRQGDYYQVYLQRVDASGSMLWTPSGVGVGGLTPDEQLPQLLADDDLAGGARVTWTEERYTSHDIFAQWIDSSGNPIWTIGGIDVCTAPGTQYSPCLVSDELDGIIITWHDDRFDTGVDLFAQRVDPHGGLLWPVEGVPVCTEAGNQLQLQLAADGYGGAIIAWVDFRSGSNYDIYTQRVDTWGKLLWPAAGVAVSTAASHQSDPVLLPDGYGGAYIVWDDDRSGTDYDVYAQHVDWNGRRAGGVWQHETDVNTPICTADNIQLEKKCVPDSSGGAILAWNDLRSGINYDIYAQRLGALGSNLWPENGVAICTAAGDQSNLQVVSDRSGGAIIVWEDTRSGSHIDIYAQRVGASGNLLWTTSGVAVCTAAGDQQDPHLTSDGAGGAIIVWEDQRSATAAYAQRVDTSGTPQWTANGRFVDFIGGSYANPRLVTDRAGGAIITWNEDTGLYAQRMDGSGTLMWGSGGADICIGASSVFGQEIVSDGVGGAIIAWSDTRSGSYPDIYCQRVNYDGSVLWYANGASICTNPETQMLSQIVSDGAEGAIIAWYDTRYPALSIFAQHVTSSGFPHWAQDGIAIGSTMSHIDQVVMVEDGSGGAIFAMRIVTSTSNAEIHSQRINRSGDYLWTADGVAVGTAPPLASDPQLVPDGAGGAIIAFNDYSHGSSNIDIYAQRVDINGYPGDPSPTIKSVIDHPDDQGGVTIISWEPSCYDEFPLQEITHYSIWSRLPEDPDRAGWTWVGEVPAYYLVEYGYNAPTYEDFTGGTPFPLTEYKVMAHTDEHWNFWESGVRSGCSVDNLAPGAPLTLLGLPDETDVLLTWEPSSDDDEDLAHYNVYRGSTPGFVADENSLIGTITDIEFTDPNPGHGTWYYRVAGEDVHGNVGTPSNETAVPLSTATVSASLSCMPSSGILPFTTGFTVQMTNQYQGQIRRIAGRINVTLANGTSYGSWRAGSTNIAAGSIYVTSWNQPIPALAPLVGDNLFQLVAVDVTPAPWNQPPYPPAGDTDSDTATLTGIAP